VSLQAPISRHGLVTGWSVELPLLPIPSPTRPTDRAQRVCLKLAGNFTEPLSGSAGFELVLWPNEVVPVGPGDSPRVGAVSATRPFKGDITVTPLEFETLRTIAAAGGRLRVTLEFETPFRGEALIQRATLTAEPAPVLQPAPTQEAPAIQAKDRAEPVASGVTQDPIAVTGKTAAKLMSCGYTTFFRRVREGTYPKAGPDGLWSVAALRRVHEPAGRI
jgi:hypothetical protein